MNTTLLQLGLLSLAIAVSASAQTYTTVMSGENSTSYSFLSGTGSRTTVTAVQSPFGYPNTTTGANDTQTYPSGSTGGNPEPWWFYYGTCGSSTCAYDLTGAAIPRGPSYGQISSQKSSVIGLLANAALEGTATTSNSSEAADMYEVFYFTERNDYQGQREIGIARQMSPYAYCNCTPYNSGDYLYAYWFTNDNCGPANSVGYPTTTISIVASCQTSQANGSVQALGSGPSGGSLLQSGYGFDFICGPTTTTCGFTGGTTAYNFQTYIFWASWDSTYKLRVEVRDQSLNVLFADNLDTTNGSYSLGLTNSGTSGYITLGTERFDPNGTLSCSGTPCSVKLSVTYVQTITP